MAVASRLGWGLLAVAMVAVVALHWKPSSQPESVLLMRHPERVHAVGDEGCLGRECNLSSSAAKQDLNNFFDNFLSKKHGSTRLVATPNTPRVHHQLLGSSAAKKDLASFYDSLPKGKTQKVQKFEAKSSDKLVHFVDKDASKEMNDFYSKLPGTVSKTIKKTRQAAEELAKEHQRKAREAYDLEHKKIEARRQDSALRTKKDIASFAAMGQQQLSMQAKGRAMQAVPTTPHGVTAEASRKADDGYFASLNAKAEAERKADILAHRGDTKGATKLSGMNDKGSKSAGGKARKGSGDSKAFLSLDNAYFSQLDLQAKALKKIDKVRLPAHRAADVHKGKFYEALKKQVLADHVKAGSPHDERIEWVSARSGMEKHLVNQWREKQAN